MRIGAPDNVLEVEIGTVEVDVPIPLSKLRHSNISRMRAAGVAADVVAAWHGHTERMTQAVYGRVTDDRLTAASAVFAPRAIGQS